MRKWTMGLLALAGSVLVFAPGAMAQSEWGDDYSNWVWDENYNPGTFYTPPTVAPGPPPGGMAPAPGYSYFSPPTAAPAAPAAPPAASGQCGTYRFWSEALGRCVDARRR